MKKFFKWLLDKNPMLFDMLFAVILIIVMYYFYHWLIYSYIDSLIKIFSKIFG